MRPISERLWQLGFGRLEAMRPSSRTALVLAFVLLLVFGDWVTGADVAFTALYLVPIGTASWFGPRAQGLLIAALCSVSWVLVYFFTRSPGNTLLVMGWNFGVQLAVFFSFAVLVHALRLALVEERRALVIEHQRTLTAQEHLQHAERLATVGKLAAGVAHELGTPLNVVSTYSQMIEAGTIGGNEAAQSAGVIRQQTQAMTRIIRQLMDFARAGKPMRRPVDVYEVLGTAVAMLRPLANGKQVELRFAPGAPLEVEGDAALLQQVITNLVVNSVDAAAAGGAIELSAGRVEKAPPPEVESTSTRWIELTVRDDGPGIDPSILAHVFEPFFTTKEVGSGTGLGLAVAWGIVREHGGWITAENVAPKGACFCVFLPPLGSA